jgi:glutathione S-transferase
MHERQPLKVPVLYVFNFSHYCEKARWALDYFGITHEVRHVMVGMHRRFAKKLGARRGSVTFLRTDGGVIAGSSAIIDWCEVQNAGKRQSLAGEEPEYVRAIEKRIDDGLGVHTRRSYYSDALINDPASVRPIFSNGLPLWQRAAVSLGWSRIVPLMIKGMDLGLGQGRQSRAVLEAELEWLDGLLADGRPYLTGSRWTRADLTAAALLGPLAAPKSIPWCMPPFSPKPFPRPCRLGHSGLRFSLFAGCMRCIGSDYIWQGAVVFSGCLPI